MRESVGEAAQRPLGGCVASVAGDGVEGGGAGGHDEVAGLLLDGGLGAQPGAQYGVRHVGGAVEVDVHLAAHRGGIHIDEELGHRDAGDAPDNVGAAAAIPGRGFSNDGIGVGRNRDVGRDVVESLRRGVLCGGLGARNKQLDSVGHWARDCWETHLDGLDGFFELGSAARYENQTGTLGRELCRRSEAHALRAASD